MLHGLVCSKESVTGLFMKLVFFVTLIEEFFLLQLQSIFLRLMPCFIIQMFPIDPNGSQNQTNIDGQRNCILIAASNPHPLPTPVYRPQTQNLEQTENIDAQNESRLSDAETVAKSFPQVH